jgi:hypothetical protein
MRKMAIRELTAPKIRQAAEDEEVIGITNNRVLAGVLIPVRGDWVEQLIEQNLSRIVHNIRRGEQEVEAVLQAHAQGASPSPEPAASFTTLEEAAREPDGGGRPSSATKSRARHVNLRDMSGEVLQDAAEQNEPIILTTDRVVAGVIFPVTQRWVTELVEQNLSRVVYNIGIGEKELSTDEAMTTLDEVLKPPSG